MKASSHENVSGGWNLREAKRADFDRCVFFGGGLDQELAAFVIVLDEVSDAVFCYAYRIGMFSSCLVVYSAKAPVGHVVP